ncbi:MAG TPA: LPS export ABC transporter periplasmic protein LptC [Cyclobacteriaceae bacterium]|jgi:LPS export ABC transporter protein LptC|nr:LPS export ABC transporter periplasmic protein LptC [Cytophagales bacterium]HNT49569.1 LPS export ABC transporter periplasmic protein LptC [Cyclobacteriaceae bacterium]HRE67766.1 LPS export ABC transporter periplasmic protein LptC [Cyclobacteriaceae bacterium]HRF34540.1 LPS export ABC transporter periplasmic protein LptC [Cyclobacteriaceae bacterium]
MKRFRFLNGIPVIGLLLAVSCNSSETTIPVEYEGPLSEAENVTMQYAEKDRVKVVLTAAKILEFENGDEEFPEGISIEFYDELGNKTSTLRANDAYFFKEENKWRGRGNVEVVNTQKEEQLNTEELFWKPADKKIFTDKFVTIKLQSEVLYGTGLEANEDLSKYQIKNPEGEFVVDE